MADMIETVNRHAELEQQKVRDAALLRQDKSRKEKLRKAKKLLDIQQSILQIGMIGVCGMAIYSLVLTEMLPALIGGAAIGAFGMAAVVIAGRAIERLVSK